MLILILIINLILFYGKTVYANDIYNNSSNRILVDCFIKSDNTGLGDDSKFTIFIEDKMVLGAPAEISENYVSWEINSIVWTLDRKTGFLKGNSEKYLAITFSGKCKSIY